MTDRRSAQQRPAGLPQQRVGPQPAADGWTDGPGGFGLAMTREQVLLERDDELALTEQAVLAAQRGAGSVIAVTGPLGNGKSALLRTMSSAGQRAGMTVLRASGARLEREYAHGVARQLVDAAQPAGAGARPAGAGAPAALDPPLAEVMIVVDDVHWADVPSLRWLARLAGRLAHIPMVLVCAVREGDPGSADPLVREILDAARTTTLRPRPLSVDGVSQLVRHRLGGTAEEPFVRACLDATGGNPMFLMSVLADLAADEVEPVAAQVDRVHAARPAQVRDRLLACVRSEPPAVRAVTRAITVLGEHADLDLVRRLSEVDGVACADALRTLHRLGLLAGPRVPRFDNDIVRDACEESMSIEERERAHVRAVELLHQSGRPAEQVATQLLAISSVHLPWADEALRAAADIAIRRGAPDAAAGYLRRLLLHTSPGGDDRAVAHLELAGVLRGVDPARSVRHVINAVTLFDAPRDRANAVARLSPAVLGDTGASMRDLLHRIGRELGDPNELTGADRALALRLAARQHHLGRTDPAEIASSVRRLRALPPDAFLNTAVERELLTTLLHAAMLGVGASAQEVTQRAGLVLSREPATKDHVHGAMPLLVETLCAADAPDRLVPWLDMAMEHVPARGAGAERRLIRAEQALVALHQGRLTAAADIARQALADTEVDWRQANTTGLLPLAAVALNTQDSGLLARLSVGPPDHVEHVHVAAVVGMIQAVAAARAGDAPSALAHVLEAGRRLERVGWGNPVLFGWRIVAARLYHRLGEAGPARELAVEAGERAEAWGAPSGVGRAQVVLGELTEGQRGVDLLRSAVEVLRTSADRAQLAQALLRLGRRLEDVDRPAAAECLRQSAEIATDCGDTVTANRARQPAGLGLGAAELTKSERRVTALAAAGRTNADIATALAVSVRAVEKHLTNSYRKLGVGGRGELAALLPHETDHSGQGQD